MFFKICFTLSRKLSFEVPIFTPQRYKGRPIGRVQQLARNELTLIESLLKNFEKLENKVVEKLDSMVATKKYFGVSCLIVRKRVSL